MVWFAIAAVASAAASAFGSAKAGEAADKAGKMNQATYEANAAFTEQDKPIVTENARIERRRLAQLFHATVGDVRAKTAAAGFDPNFGSALAMQGDAKLAYDIDRRIIARNEVTQLQDKDREAYNYRRQGVVARAEGRAAKTAGYLQAASTLLQAAPSVSRMLPRG